VTVQLHIYIMHYSECCVCSGMSEHDIRACIVNCPCIPKPAAPNSRRSRADAFTGPPHPTLETGITAQGLGGGGVLSDKTPGKWVCSHFAPRPHRGVILNCGSLCHMQWGPNRHSVSPFSAQRDPRIGDIPLTLSHHDI
jgi:hypothetical protein